MTFETSNTDLEKFFKAINSVINPPEGVDKPNLNNIDINIDGCNNIYNNSFLLKEIFIGEEDGSKETIENILGKIIVDLMFISANNQIDLGEALRKIYNTKMKEFKNE